MSKPGMLTDRQLAQLLDGLSSHYLDCRSRGEMEAGAFQELSAAINYSLTSSDSLSPLKNLSHMGKLEVHRVKEIFFTALGSRQSQLFRETPVAIPIEGVPQAISGIPLDTRNHHSHHYYYHHHRDSSFAWWLLYYQMCWSPRPRLYAIHSNTSHHNHYVRDNKKNDGSALAIAAVGLIIVTAIAATFVALYYLLNETINSMERFWHHEGWLQAALTLMGGMAAGIGCSLLASTFLTPSLVSLGVAAGLTNPIGLAVLGIICVSLVGSVLGCTLVNFAQQSYLQQTNTDSLEPNDPHRFALTDKEASHLQSKNIDPLVVRCVIAKLHAEIAREGMPAPLPRLFSSQANHLTTIRQLRSGRFEKEGVQIGNEFYQIKNSLPFERHIANNAVYALPQQGIEPSAPPAQFG